jgi:hypothetical protein
MIRTIPSYLVLGKSNTGRAFLNDACTVQGRRDPLPKEVPSYSVTGRHIFGRAFLMYPGSLHKEGATYQATGRSFLLCLPWVAPSYSVVGKCVGASPGCSFHT